MKLTWAKITKIRDARERLMARRRKTGALAVKDAVKAGLLADLKCALIPCVDCGKIAVCYDHRDYSKPLEVEPVCKSCDAKRGPGEPYDGMYQPWEVRRLRNAKANT